MNIASRLEGMAEPGEICLSEAVYAFVRKLLPLAYTDLGEQHVKNIDEPLRVYTVRPVPASISPSNRPARDTTACWQALHCRSAFRESERAGR